jgi:cytochrome P450
MNQRIDGLPHVVIPDYAWGPGGELASYIAGLALEHGPIFTYSPEVGPHADRQVLMMVGPEANRFVLHTQRDTFSHDLGWTPVIGDTLGRGLLNMDAPEHTRHRAMMNPAFTASFMASYLPVMQRVIEQRTRDWAEHDEVDVYHEAREITFDIAAAALVGFQAGAEVDFLRECFYTLLHGFDEESQTWEEYEQQQRRIRDQLVIKLLELIAARRAAPAGNGQDDVLGMMVRARDEQGQALTDEQLLAHVNILLVAGHETTTTLASWLLYLLATHPQEAARIEAELGATLGDDVRAPLTFEAVRGLPVLSNAIREAGRLQSPVLLLPRGVVKEFTFADHTVPAGLPMFLAIAAGHRLPTIFAQPETFDPDRFEPPREEDKRHPYSLVTFGGGSRICIGVNFAQVETKALAAHVLRTYRLAPVEDRAPIQAGGIVPFLVDGIHVRFVPRA